MLPGNIVDLVDAINVTRFQQDLFGTHGHELLEAAYKNAMERARENELKSVGFCILSAGIFRGGCPLKVVIETGLKAIAKNTYSGLETIVFCGFTPQEQAELHDLAASLA